MSLVPISGKLLPGMADAPKIMPAHMIESARAKFIVSIQP
ncbi:hypothetical protein DBT_2165 [Dissulfuribacter thermophilus]|uniref:Uncharacterized protein n=1 Tax=Dissulfuribacter thermophilus TaxID=1156395 RepID=A0A1B9F3D0_9BACT|nr:hypothetical protein DBT_2165 [Dissulfuribacter thermophilus]